MECKHYDRARFIVTSHGQDFLVDTLANEGCGSCDCVHFKSRIQPEIERLRAARALVPGPALECPHLTKANAALLNMFKQQLIAQFNDSEQET